MLKRFIVIAILICVFIFSSSCASISDAPHSGLTGTVPSAERQLESASTTPLDKNAGVLDISPPYAEDLLFLSDILKANHPGFSKADYDASVARIMPQLGDMDESAFNLAVRRILAEMGDAHTYSFQPERAGDHMVPIWQLQRYDDGWFLDGIHESLAEYIGYEVVAINEIPINDAVKIAKPYISHETDERLYTSFSQEIKNSGFLKDLQIITDDAAIPMTLKDAHGQLIQANIQTYAIDDYMQYQSGAWIEFPQTGQYSGPNYYFKPLDQDILFVQYSFCNEREDCPIPEFLEQISNQLDNGGYRALIFDLRFNGGGDVRLFQPVIDAIGKYKDKQGFDLYCLVAPNTFSTGLIHAVQLKKLGATIVGQATGGLVNFYADTQTVQLPISGTTISFSTNFVETMPGYKGTNLLPDMKVNNMHSDIINGVDEGVIAVLKKLR